MDLVRIWCFVMLETVCIAFGIYTIVTGLLGIRKSGRYCIFYCCVFTAIQTATNIYVMLAKVDINAFPGFWNLWMYTVQGIAMAAFLRVILRVPLAKGVSAVALGQLVLFNWANTFESAAVDAIFIFVTNVVQRIMFNILFDVAIILASLLLARVFRKIRFHQYFDHLFSNSVCSILTPLVSAVLMYTSLFLMIKLDESGAYRVLGTIFIIIIMLFCVQFVAMYSAGRDKIQVQQEAIAQQQEQICLLEELQQEMRTFRHDFTNLLSGISLQAQAGDMVGVQKFLKQNSAYFDEKLGAEIQRLEGLGKIQIDPLRSLLTAKIAFMRQKHIQPELEVMFPVNGIQMEVEDMLRCLGILLDNAIEATDQELGIIRMVLLQQQKELFVVVANNFVNKPDLTAMQKQNYTTKGNGHGTGLNSYRNILGGYPDCVARTYIKDDFFCQELHIPVKMRANG